MFSITCSELSFEQLRRISDLYPSRKGNLVASLKAVREFLSHDPLGCSESRQNRDRVCIVSPLTFFFTIDFQHDTVEIIPIFFNVKT